MTGASQPPLIFWFEFASPYSYLAALRIEAAAQAAGIGHAWPPFLLGPILARRGFNDSPFNLDARRGDYMWRDVERLRARDGIDWRRPTVFPRSELLAARVATAMTAETWSRAFCLRCFAPILPRIAISRRPRRTAKSCASSSRGPLRS